MSTPLAQTGPTATWPIIGRDRELTAIAQARRHGASGVVLHAPSGVGKSRVAREALIQAEREGAITVWVQGTRSAASTPMGAFAGVISPEVRSENLFVLLRQLGEALSELAGGQTLVLGVDDGQLLDPASAALVHHLVDTAAAFVVTTVRSGAPCPDAIVTLWKERLVPRLELAGLGEADTVTLAETILGGPVEHALARWIWETSRGNAMYVRELLLAARGDGALQPADGLWRMPATPPISSTLLDLISARLAGLDDDERRVLELLAVGEPLYVSEVVNAAGADRFEALEARGLIAVQGAPRGSGEVHIGHPLYGEGIRAKMGSYRGHVTRLALVDLVTARPQRTPELALRIARWLLDAGERVPRATLLEAARAANLSGDPELGARLAHDAVREGAGIEARLVLARSYSIRNRYQEAADLLNGAESSIRTQDQALAYLHQQLEVLYLGLKRLQPIRELSARAQAWWSGEVWRKRFAPLRLLCDMAALGPLGDAGEILAESSQLLGSEAVDAEARRHLELVELAGLYRAGRGTTAYQLARRIRPALPLRDATDATIWSLSVGIVCETGAGVHEAGAWARGALDESVRVGDRAAAGIAALALGHLNLLGGRLPEASRWLAEAQLHQGQHDPLGCLVITSALQACVASLTCDQAGAVAALERCRAGVWSEEPLPVQARFLVCADAWVAAATGKAAAGRRTLLEAAEANVGSVLYTVRLLYEALRLGAPARELAPTLRDISADCDAPLIAAKAHHASCLADRDAPGLLAVADEFERVGARLYGCEAAADATRIFHAAGHEPAVRRAAARTRSLLTGGRDWASVRIGDRSATAGLTAREGEVVQLTALGLGNREIAEDLALSKRTVESHLYRAMQKLGVNDRSEL
jgi:DNA-binding CsgD family transcriptional regulator